jgi:predicted small lipoprotein YifL
VKRSGHALLAATSLALLLAGCGLKGSLYLPEKPKEVVVRPGPAATSAPATGSGTVQEAPPPAPQVPEEGPATEPEVPDETMTPPPALPEDPTPPPGEERG